LFVAACLPVAAFVVVVVAAAAAAASQTTIPFTNKPTDQKRHLTTPHFSAVDNTTPPQQGSHDSNGRGHQLRQQRRTFDKRVRGGMCVSHPPLKATPIINRSHT